IEAAPKVPAGSALTAGFAAPPRTITDITAILDGEKPDLKTIEGLKAEADSKPNGKESREGLAQFYFDRSNARAQLGRLADSIADANKAVEVGRGAITPLMMGRLIAFAAQQYSAAGDPKKAFELYQRQLSEVAPQRKGRGYQFSANRAIAAILIQMGDIAQAEAYIRRNQPLLQEVRTSGLPPMRAAYNTYGQMWESEIEHGRAMLFEARGQYRDAEAAYKLVELRRRAAIKPLLGSENPPSESSMLLGVDFAVLNQARMKVRQGR